MKKIFTLSTMMITVGVLLVQTSGNEAISNVAGAPAGRTGSPADGLTCATSNCHGSNLAPSATQIISSNVPVTGYVPGQTYTITAAVSQAGIPKFGFEISPQSVNGALQGSLIITNPSATKIVGTKYVTHTSAGTAASGGARTWSFNWVAPVAGTGDVTFYGAFNFANGNTQSTGDAIKTNTLTIPEDQSTAGLAPVYGDDLSAVLFPNPVAVEATLRLNLKTNEQVEVQLLDIQGKQVGELMLFDGAPGNREFKINVPEGLPSGIYRLLITQGSAGSVKTFYKN